MVACDQKLHDLYRDDDTDTPAPTSATFQLAPAAPAAQASPASAKPTARQGENLLAATAVPDATPPSPAAAASPGAASGTCVNGWTTPERGSALRGAVLDMMRVQKGERFVVEEMRYFVGPEDAEVLGVRGDVERWYVKATTETEPKRRQRWLVRRAKIGSGIDAVAPFESTGYGPGTWRRPDANDPSLADPFERPCQGTKPGDKCMGLPREVLGCLAGT
ncbi:MAG TPA: hypothetical protein VMG12_36960 [Polyangiaceae bacterium]|nr:hypothetical protein [Polyangiaceae bacterium]